MQIQGLTPFLFLSSIITVLALSATVDANEPSSGGWAPAAGAVMTRWAKDVSPGKVHPEYPRPQLVRTDWLNLNGLWQLELGKAGDDVVPVGKDLPLRILVPFAVQSSLSGIMRRSDRLWYRRLFQVPDNWQGRRVWLHFQAVDWETQVYLNGKPLGGHRGGYDAFSFDITDALRPDGSQELVVGVSDPTNDGDQPRGKQSNKSRGIWYTPTTGIWQTVWLEPVPTTRIERLVLRPDLDGSCLRLTAVGVGAGNCSIQAVARDGLTDVARADGGMGAEIRLVIPKDKLKPWSPGTPFLYDLTVTLKQDGRDIDQVTSYFGMRKIDLAKDGQGRVRMRINNEFVFQVGPLDQGFWPDGIYTAPTDDALRYDIEVTKQLGFNMTRKHVKVEPERWYYWCDKLGLLVWQDMPSSNNLKSGPQLSPESKHQFEAELRRMVGGFGNHPSIIMWVIFNEGWGQHDTQRYVGMVKQLDPSRLVSSLSGAEISGSNSSRADTKSGDVLDIHMYRHPKPPPLQADRAGVIGECGGMPLAFPANADFAEGTRRYVELLGRLRGYGDSDGLSGVVYTQLTNVENERNGLLTYDRAVIQVDVEKVAAANRGQ